MKKNWCLFSKLCSSLKSRCDCYNMSSHGSHEGGGGGGLGCEKSLKLRFLSSPDQLYIVQYL